MKRIALFFALIFLLSYAVKSQTVDSLWNGYLSPFVQTGGTAPNFTIQGAFVSNGGFTGSQIELSKKPRLIVYSSNKCYELPFTAISGTGSIIAGTVIDPSGQLSAIPSGSAIVFQPSSVYRVGPFPTGISASLQGCLQTYNNLKIDSLQLGSGITLGDKQDIDVVSTNVWVIDTNAVTTIKIANSAVDSNKIAADAVRTSDIGNAQVTMPKIAQSGASSGQVIKWNGSGWAPATDNNTTYTPGTGIGITGNTISNTGVTSINGEIGDLTDYLKTTDPVGSVGGDVTGTIDEMIVIGLQGIPVDGTPPTSGQVLKFDGTDWKPGADGEISIIKSLSTALVDTISKYGFVSVYADAAGDFFLASTTSSTTLHSFYLNNYIGGKVSILGSGVMRITATFSYVVGKTYYLTDSGSLSITADADGDTQDFDSSICTVVASLGSNNYIVVLKDPRHFINN